MLNPQKSPISIPKLEMLISLPDAMFKTLGMRHCLVQLGSDDHPWKKVTVAKNWLWKKTEPPIQPKGLDKGRSLHKRP